jgi:pseudoazurin
MSVRLVSVGVALWLTFGSAGTHAADIVIRMVDMSKDGPLTYDPIFVTANVGDTLVFTPQSKGHTTQSLLVPEGTKPWKGDYDTSMRIAVEKEGIYLYGCQAHLRMGMVGVVQVGRAENLGAATKAAAEASAQFVMNKDRFATALAQVR